MPDDPELPEGGVTIVEPENYSRGDARRRWAELIRLVYEVDALACPRCGGEMRVIAPIPGPAVIDKIMRHLRAKERYSEAHSCSSTRLLSFSPALTGSNPTSPRR